MLPTLILDPYEEALTLTMKFIASPEMDKVINWDGENFLNLSLPHYSAEAIKKYLDLISVKMQKLAGSKAEKFTANYLFNLMNLDNLRPQAVKFNMLFYFKSLFSQQEGASNYRIKNIGRMTAQFLLYIGEDDPEVEEEIMFSILNGLNEEL